jgi:uncharacterized membrane protein
MNEYYFFSLVLGIGIVAGLRSLTVPAVVAWAAYLGWLNLQDSRLAFMGSIVAAVIFSLLALGELIGDKLPKTPRRTALASLLARICTGALGGACLGAATNRSLLVTGLLGGIGGVIGAFAGYEIRRRLVSQFQLRDFFVAVFEDLIAIGLACFLVWSLAA